MSEKRCAMPRKPLCRNIHSYPDFWSFSPDDPGRTETIILSLDEYETIRLIDYEGLTQEQCGGRMGVARTTVTAIYDSARKKLSKVIVEGKRLQIAGGNYQIISKFSININKKGSNAMRIAVAYENGQIFQHFGRTEQFKIYDVEDGKIVSEQILSANGIGHGALAGLLKMADTDVLICGGIGMGARTAMAETGIKIYPGAQGSADSAAEAFLAGNLSYDPDAECGHRNGEEHQCGHEHGKGHQCGHEHGEEH